MTKHMISHFWGLYDSWKYDIANSIAKFRGYEGCNSSS